ncbi:MULTISPECIES: hypothetical protein [Clostridia]|uniref:hypothetical protein n=1 Tax=Clostridia TaxID=186801 RepID=UPI00189FDB2E|nr:MULTISPECIES: hypothetical protein [Clostridia]MDY3375041.1 hypothetical protein [Terrisporobacter othiniensis]
MKVFIIVNIIIAALMYLEKYLDSYTYGMKVWITNQSLILAVTIYLTGKFIYPIVLLIGINIIMNIMIMPIFDIIHKLVIEKVQLKR